MVERIPLAHELDCFDAATEVIDKEGGGLSWLGFVEMEVTGKKAIGVGLAVACDRSLDNRGDGSRRLSNV